MWFVDQSSIPSVYGKNLVLLNLTIEVILETSTAASVHSEYQVSDWCLCQTVCIVNISAGVKMAFRGLFHYNKEFLTKWSLNKIHC